MEIRLALAGNPNTGKTTLFNALTGSTQHVGNWPGVTVEKKDGRLKSDKSVIIEDLPGIYSLSPYTAEEIVSRNYIIHDKPDAILNIVDATNLERNLYLSTQLIEVGIPVVIALNMMDVIRKNGDQIHTKKLGDMLGCEVVEISALKGDGIQDAVKKAVAVAKSKKEVVLKQKFSEEIEKVIQEISEIITGKADSRSLRWYAVKLLERDEEIQQDLQLNASELAKIEKLVTACEEIAEDDSESIITGERYAWIASVTEKCVHKKDISGMTASDKIDRIVTHRIFALPLFAVIMFLVYFISISTVGTMATDWVNDVLFGEIVPTYLGGALENLGLADWLYGLIMDGIVGGVGAVLGFLPQMLVLFICLAILEDCGYMARIAFVLDRIFRKFGLSGKSFIPMLVSTGCGVPGIMASRTIESDNDRRMTIMTTTFIPCGAKLPIIALIAGAFFPEQAWIAPSAYFLGIACVIASGIILKKTKLFAGDPAPFVIELPAYHLPGAGNVFRTMLDRGFAFIKKATSIVLVSTVLIWFLQSFNLHLEMVDAEESMLAGIGKMIAPIFAPLGFGDWKAAVASLTGLIAKENLVGTFGVLYGFEEVAEDGEELWATLGAAYTPVAAYAMMAFNLLCVPCFAAVGALRREMMSGKMTWFAVGYQCALAYIVSLMIYQFGTLLTTGAFGIGTVFAIACLLFVIYLLFIKKAWSPEKKTGLSLERA
ncbi:MAG: ferrous iron transport protein B [Oscillospiraceae bacterium]|nr:ferrous iron transport protein B [Oscillospiraceae bacterium]